MQHALQEPGECFRVCISFKEPEVQLPLRRYCGDHVNALAVPGALDNRRAANLAPCRPGMVIGPYSGLVSEEDRSSRPRSRLPDGRVIHFLPPPDPLGILLILSRNLINGLLVDFSVPM